MYPYLEKVQFVQGGRVLLKFSEGVEYRVDESVYLELSIALDSPLTPDLEDRLDCLKQLAECRQKAMKLLAAKPLSTHQLKQKLIRGDRFDEAVVFKVIEELTQLAYLDDVEYCRLFIEESLRLKPGYGKNRIKQKLLSKGLGEEVIDAGLQMFLREPEEEYRIVQDLAHKKWNSYPAKLEFVKKKSRLYRFLATRGFAAGMISRVMNEFVFNSSGLD